MSNVFKVWKMGRNGLPVETTAEQFGWPHKDSDGDDQFENTHFLTETECWHHCIEEFDAGVFLEIHVYRDAKADLVMATKRLAEAADNAARVRAAFVERQKDMDEAHDTHKEPTP